MKKAKTTTVNPYRLAVRVRLKNGQWGEWECKGEGEWIGLEHVQNQISMLRQAYKRRDMQIAFSKEGKYYDYNGNETGKAIDYEASGR